MPRTSNQAKPKAVKSMEAALWESCNKLRGAVEPAEYKHVVLSLIFLKYAGDRFELRKQELLDSGLQEYIDQVEFYTALTIQSLLSLEILIPSIGLLRKFGEKNSILYKNNQNKKQENLILTELQSLLLANMGK